MVVVLSNECCAAYVLETGAGLSIVASTAFVRLCTGVRRATAGAVALKRVERQPNGEEETED